jgi:hypothetical protein
VLEVVTVAVIAGDLRLFFLGYPQRRNTVRQLAFFPGEALARAHPQVFAAVFAIRLSAEIALLSSNRQSFELVINLQMAKAFGRAIRAWPFARPSDGIAARGMSLMGQSRRFGVAADISALAPKADSLLAQ